MESTSSAVDSSREIEIQTEKEKMKKKKGMLYVFIWTTKKQPHRHVAKCPSLY